MIWRADGRVRRGWRILGAIAALPVLAVLAFMVAAWIGSSLPRNGDWREARAAEPGIDILVETNGIHTGIVMPIVSAEKDWRTTFPSAARPRPDGRMPTHIAIGWGEKEVFLNTPTWAELKASTAARIVFRGGDGLMRVGHYVRPAPGENHRPLRLRPAEYRKLAKAVEAALPQLPEGAVRTTYPSFEIGAANYDARGRYTIGNTCNQWVGDTLAQAGVKMGRWTPLAGGVMKWIRQP